VRGRLTGVSKATAEDEAILGHLMFVAAQVAHADGIGETGFRVIINDVCGQYIYCYSVLALLVLTKLGP
jgi:hypothetical protein